MNFGLRNTRKRNLTLVGAMAFMTVCFMAFQSSSVYAKTAKEIDVSVDVALENFNKTVKGGNEFEDRYENRLSVSHNMLYNLV